MSYLMHNVASMELFQDFRKYSCAIRFWNSTQWNIFAGVLDA